MVHFNFIKQEIHPSTILDTKVDVSFRRVTKNASCFFVWKIEEDRLDSEPKMLFGTFYDNCAYIIYAASTVGQYVNKDTISREQKTAVTMERYLHFWLGSNVTEQNRSNVVHKIQELDSYLGNVASIYRETQNYESARFLSYFTKGITIRSGALVNSTEPKRLIQVFGRQCLRCIEMPAIEWQHFNSEYVMVLKTETCIYVWIGRSSSSIERRKAIEWATSLRKSNNEILLIDDGYEQSMPEHHKLIWNKLLPLQKRLVTPESPIAELQSNNKLRIYLCNYRGSRLHLDQLDVVIPTKDDLSDSSAVYVIDSYGQGIWLWVGSQVSKEENLQAMGNGRAFVKKKKYLNGTPVIRVVDGYEPIEFKRLFPNWATDTHDISTTTLKPISSKFGKFDPITLCQRPKMAADIQLIDDGSGERTIYRITKDQVIEMPASKMNIFTTNNCYVIKYTVACATPHPADAESIGIKTIIYQWNGSCVATEAMTKAERFAKSCFESIDEKGMFVQMCEYDETPHFLQIFEGKLIILQGNKNSSINLNNNNNNNVDSAKSASTLNRENIVLKIYGDATYNSKAVEIYPLTTMCSKECYVIKTNHVWIWCGQSSTGDAREIAKTVGSLIGECSLVLEGKESKEFWHSVSHYLNHPIITTNGNGTPNSDSSNSSTSSTYSGINSHGNSNGNISPYTIGSAYISTNSVTKSHAHAPQAQLFLIWTQQGKYYNQEIIGFGQNDLHSDCCYVLDGGTLSYVWLGEHVSTADKQKYLNIGQYYLSTVPIARRPPAALAIVRQHNEPNVFKGFFNNWNANLWHEFESYEQKRKLFFSEQSSAAGCGVNGENGKNATPLPPALLQKKKEFDRFNKYPIPMLQQEVETLPQEINPLLRELHLTHDDFVSLFKMTYWEFDELPGWRKQELKKKVKLF